MLGQEAQNNINQQRPQKVGFGVPPKTWDNNVQYSSTGYHGNDIFGSQQPPHSVNTPNTFITFDGSPNEIWKYNLPHLREVYTPPAPEAIKPYKLPIPIPDYRGGAQQRSTIFDEQLKQEEDPALTAEHDNLTETIKKLNQDLGDTQAYLQRLDADVAKMGGELPGKVGTALGLPPKKPQGGGGWFQGIKEMLGLSEAAPPALSDLGGRFPTGGKSWEAEDIDKYKMYMEGNKKALLEYKQQAAELKKKLDEEIQLRDRKFPSNNTNLMTPEQAKELNEHNAKIGKFEAALADWKRYKDEIDSLDAHQNELLARYQADKNQLNTSETELEKLVKARQQKTQALVDKRMAYIELKTYPAFAMLGEAGMAGYFKRISEREAAKGDEVSKQLAKALLDPALQKKMLDRAKIIAQSDSGPLEAGAGLQDVYSHLYTPFKAGSEEKQRREREQWNKALQEHYPDANFKDIEALNLILHGMGLDDDWEAGQALDEAYKLIAKSHPKEAFSVFKKYAGFAAEEMHNISPRPLTDQEVTRRINVARQKAIDTLDAEKYGASSFTDWLSLNEMSQKNFKRLLPDLAKKYEEQKKAKSDEYAKVTFDNYGNLTADQKKEFDILHGPQHERVRRLYSQVQDFTNAPLPKLRALPDATRNAVAAAAPSLYKSRLEALKDYESFRNSVKDAVDYILLSDEQKALYKELFRQETGPYNSGEKERAAAFQMAVWRNLSLPSYEKMTEKEHEAFLKVYPEEDKKLAAMLYQKKYTPDALPTFTEYNDPRRKWFIEMHYPELAKKFEIRRIAQAADVVAFAKLSAAEKKLMETEYPQQYKEVTAQEHYLDVLRSSINKDIKKFGLLTEREHDLLQQIDRVYYAQVRDKYNNPIK